MEPTVLLKALSQKVKHIFLRDSGRISKDKCKNSIKVTKSGDFYNVEIVNNELIRKLELCFDLHENTVTVGKDLRDTEDWEYENVHSLQSDISGVITSHCTGYRGTLYREYIGILLEVLTLEVNFNELKKLLS